MTKAVLVVGVILANFCESMGAVFEELFWDQLDVWQAFTSHANKTTWLKNTTSPQ